MIGPAWRSRLRGLPGVTDNAQGGIGWSAALTQDVLPPEADGRLRLSPFAAAVEIRLKLLLIGTRQGFFGHSIIKSGTAAAFPWPAMTEGAARLTPAQLAMFVGRH